jgi:hypothetical protein
MQVYVVWPLACVTTKEIPAMETIAERAAPVLAATTNVIVAGPVPEALPDETIHEGRLAIVQEHEASV